MEVEMPRADPDLEQAARDGLVRAIQRFDLTQRRIAAQLGVSRSQVGRLLGSALDHLRQTAAAA